MKSTFRFASAAILAALVGLPTACSQAEAEADVVVPAETLALFKVPLNYPKADTPETPEKIALGKKLYHDPRLSREGKVSCASCHNLEKFGVDGEKTSAGTGGQRGDRNSPTSLNAFLNFRQFWDGRAKDVEEQAQGPITNPIEHGINDAAEVAAILSKDPEMVAAFKAAFPGEADPVSLANFGRAVGAFERTLRTRAKFDDFLDGDQTALTNAQKRGLELFVASACTTCHLGPILGGQMYNKLGLVHPYETKDLGRYRVTKKDSDKHFFKVPSLLNVAETGPYFHDGSIATLEEAVEKMAWHQLGKKLKPAATADLVAFLGSLTGTLPAGTTDN